MVNDLLQHNEPARPIATETESVFAWMRALRKADESILQPLLPLKPDHHDLLGWYELAAAIAHTHAELAGGNQSFGDVEALAERLEMFRESERWRTLAALHRIYRKELKKAGLADLHQVRRFWLRRAAQNESARGDRHIVLIGIAELNAVQRTVITLYDEHVTALIHAPESMRDRFDEFGCVAPAAWSDVTIDIDDAHIRVADRPEDQAQETLRTLAGFGEQYAATQITIGLGDSSLAPVIERNARWAGVRVDSALGRSIRRSAPYRLLSAIADWLTDQRFANFAALLRHPDIESWLLRHEQAFTAQLALHDGLPLPSQPTGVDALQAGEGVTDWLMLLDQYFADHLHDRLSGKWLGDLARRRWLKQLYKAVHTLLAPLVPHDWNQSGGSKVHRKRQLRHISHWCQPILDVLLRVYDTLDATSEEPAARAALEACVAMRECMTELVSIPQRLQPRTDAAGAIRLLLTLVAGNSIVQETDPQQIAMLGWLELHLDLAPALVIAGFNDGRVPEAIAGDLFLPDALRSKLGLTCNASRYARDAYLLEAMRHSRERFTLIVGRHTADGDPLTPSRLLLACDEETLLRRIRAMCDEQVDAVKLPPIGMPAHGATSLFTVPPLPAQMPSVQRMNVTDFRAYLACPYRFALEKLLRLEHFDDDAVEMDPGSFGTLAHDVLCAFGKHHELSLAENEREIETYLLDTLADVARQRFGPKPMPAVRIQLARLQQRLRSFARFQAQHRALGWRIMHCELSFAGVVPLDVPGDQPMPIHGKIDRIDRNETTGRWLIIDYKTSESGQSPHKTHHGRERLVEEDLEWLDLQLPLYHYLATHADLGIEGEIDLGYIVLPQQTDGVRLRLAEWSCEQLEQAIDLAREIVRRIRSGDFAMRSDVDPSYDIFARICQSLVFGAGEAEEGDE